MTPFLTQVDELPLRLVTTPALRPPTPYLDVDVSLVRRQLSAIRAALPGASIHYAVKCNPHPRILSTLAAANCNFEIASVAELDLLLDAGVAAGALLYSNPVKATSHIEHAYTKGVRYFAADCTDEIDKLARYAPGCSVLIRIDVSNSGSVVPLAGKFGAAPAAVPALAVMARSRGLMPTGLTFHVGSQALDPGRWRDALAVCGTIMRKMLAVGLRISLIDLGGGYPVPYDEPVAPIASIGLAVRDGLALLPYAVDVAAEPGRFLTAEAGTMVTTVIGRASRRGEEWLHLDIGAFGGLMEALETRRGLHYPVRCTHAHSGPPPRRIRMSVTGPTCDSEDTVLDHALLCSELRTGDVVHLGMAGAYTTAYASTFNGFPLPVVLVRDHEPPGPAVDNCSRLAVSHV